ncbi:hypothetical protein [Nonomuraea ferruginea]|uniref:ATP-grasp domain-containing protein n=2 Tax=Nonomuraea ferruginea TaxID=46174 RepID=A0ABT4T650_9ACTN|nr:hypothetical protein [Nonomuraea ferruginea]MDA0644986.1 hypothetical protein [Nonomuraea ferruginea]
MSLDVREDVCRYCDMRSFDQVAVYEHRAWKGFLLPAVLPGARRITAGLGEGFQDVLSRIPAGCRLFVFHINLTLSARVPFDREKLVGELRARGVTVRNAGITDISKRAVQRACARAGVATATAPRQGDPGEPLLVKTNCNYHGVRECELTLPQRRMLGYEAPHDMPSSRAEGEYRVMRRDEVPPAIWASPHWVVERYITNAAHRFHRVYLAGEAMVVSRVHDSAVFKKMPVGITRESYYLKTSDAGRPAALPADVGAVAAMSARVSDAARVEYGAFDVVSDDHGGLYLIDVNTTPSWGDGGHPDLLAYLGAGLVRNPDGG